MYRIVNTNPMHFNLSTSYRQVLSFTLRTPLLVGKGPMYPLDRRLSGRVSYNESVGKEEYSNAHARNLTSVVLPVLVI